MSKASEWWAQRKLMGYYMTDQPWTPALVDTIVALEPRRVVEFGCNVGRNLRALRAAAPDMELVGIDVNEQAVAWGRASTASTFATATSGSSSRTPTTSPSRSASSTTSQSPRAPRRPGRPAPLLLLVEPWTGTEGPLKSHNPYTYGWDYTTRLRSLGLVVSSRRFPISDKSIGPEYRIFRARRKP